MRAKYVLDFLKTAIAALKLQGVDDARIALPNAPIDAGSLSLYFELFVSDCATRADTERSVVTTCRAAIAVSGAYGDGLERVDAIAQALVDLFASYNADSLRGWSARETIFASPRRGKLARVYVAGVERSNGTVVDGRYKVKIIVHLEIYEEEI